MKIVITGNSGSGKTWLAHKLSSPESILIHLDTLFWKPGGFEQKREQAEIETLISESLNHKYWVAEGVFGELVNRYTNEANLFIFLDMPWELCRMRLEKRGAESIKHMERLQSPESLKALIKWAQDYYNRTDLRSKPGHLQMYESFHGSKIHLTSEEATNDFIDKYHSKAY